MMIQNITISSHPSLFSLNDHRSGRLYRRFGRRGVELDANGVHRRGFAGLTMLENYDIKKFSIYIFAKANRLLLETSIRVNKVKSNWGLT